MYQQRTFEIGDQVRHPKRPEWGEGKVQAARIQTTNGKQGQLLTIRFDVAGKKNMNTAFAPLILAKDFEATASGAREKAKGLASSSDDGKLVVSLSREEIQKQLHDLALLPEVATDVFASLRARFRATMDLYRFDYSGKGMIEWASAQTGLKDPLTRWDRHELEEAFKDFQHALLMNMKHLMGQLKRDGRESLLEELVKYPNPRALAALQEAMKQTGVRYG